MSLVAATVDTPARRRPVVRRRNGYKPPALPPTGGGEGPEREPEPRGPLIDNARLATLFLIGGEIMFFGGLVAAFFVLRLTAPTWPPPRQPRLPIAVTGLNRLVLLSSSVAMLRATRALRHDDRRGLSRALTRAGALGAVFLVVQGYEWARLIGFGLTMASGPYGSTFYTLIGTHGLHVVGALAWVGLTLLRVSRGRVTVGAVRACAMYWHFIVALWPILYVAVYLL